MASKGIERYREATARTPRVIDVSGVLEADCPAPLSSSRCPLVGVNVCYQGSQMMVSAALQGLTAEDATDLVALLRGN